MPAKETILDPNKVLLYYQCETCGTEVSVNPWFFEDSGTPVCAGVDPECDGDDMKFVRIVLLEETRG